MTAKYILAISICITFSSNALGVVIDFDDLSIGSEVSSIETSEGFVHFNSNTNLELVVSSKFLTSSGTNYLEVADDDFEVFSPDDNVNLVFESAINILAVDLISPPNTPAQSFLDNPAAASRLVEEAFDKTERLVDFPQSGRIPPELPNSVYREVGVLPCRIFYRVDAG